jgi:hypothetical protein
VKAMEFQVLTRKQKQEILRRNREAMRAIEAKRIALGVCRHCAGPIPCWSPAGDKSKPLPPEPEQKEEK